jgi:hypothetical protein
MPSAARRCATCCASPTGCCARAGSCGCCRSRASPAFRSGARVEERPLPLALDEKIAALERALAEAQLPHAFGGALALAYYATPRGTHDIDLNLFVPAARAERVLALLAGLGVATGGETALREIRERGQTRLRWEHTPLDLFFSTDALHESCLERVRRVPFGADEIAILSAEDLAVFKAIFDRPKDWSDLAEVLYAQGPDFDAAYVTGWLRRILPEDDARLRHFETLVREPEAT